MNKFDVLVPAHGEPVDQIFRLLTLVSCQQTPGWKLNKLLMCSDNKLIIEQFQDCVTVHFIQQQKGKGKPDALNKLFKESTAKYCIQNSADCLPASPYAYKFLLEPLLKKEVGAVTSQPVPLNHGFMFLPNIVWRCHSFVQPKLSGELFSIKKRLINKLPETVIHDDAYIHAHLLQQGYKVVYEPKAIVLNCPPKTLTEFYSQRKKNVTGNMQLSIDFNVNPPRAMRTRSLILMSLEILANVHGRLDYLRGKIPVGLVGYNLPSTKEVIK